MIASLEVITRYHVSCDAKVSRDIKVSRTQMCPISQGLANQKSWEMIPLDFLVSQSMVV